MFKHNTLPLSWHTEKRKISDLTPFESNPRNLTEPQYKKLRESLEKFDLAEIPAIDTDGKIIAGHQRLKILQELKGDVEIDVRIPNRKLTKKEFEEYNVRSNKNTGEWDFDILANEFELDDLLDWGFEEIDFGVGKDFEPVDIEEQGKLDQKKPKFINCPHCGEEFDINEQS